MKKAEQERLVVVAKLDRFEAYVNVATPADASNLEIRLKNVESLLDTFERVHLEIQRVDALADTGIDDFETRYFRTLAKAKDLINKSRSINKEVSPFANNVNMAVQLPTLNLPLFSGNYEQWTEFHDTFASLVHNNSNLENINKFHYLKNCLKGEAARIISSLETSNETYSIAWTLLKERYEKKYNIIKAHVKGLFNIPKINNDSAQSLRNLIDCFNRHIRALNNLGEPTKEWSTLLIHLICEKLDTNTKVRWEEHTAHNNHTMNDMLQFLVRRCEVLEAVTPAQRASKSLTCFTANLTKCAYCKHAHPIHKCNIFLEKTVEERKSIITRLGLCLNCFKDNHFVQQCRSRFNCGVCQKKHHTLLHRKINDINSSSIDVVEQPQQIPDMPIALTSTTQHQKCVYLATAIIKVQDICGQWHDARVMLDSGSQSNFITESLSRKLKLNKFKINIPVSGIGKSINNIKYACNATIKSMFNNFYSNISCLETKQIISLLPNFTSSKECLNIPKNINLADQNFDRPSPVDMLIGAGLYANLLQVGQIKLGKNNPTLQKTVLGWVVSGPVSGLACFASSSAYSNCFAAISQPLKLENIIENFWKIEEITTDKPLSREEIDCETIFRNNVTIRSDGHFQVKLPIRENISKLGDSLRQAEERFSKLERRFHANPQLLKQYSQFIDEYKLLGHMTEISNLNLEYDTPTYYMPHHAVFKSSSTTTKLRVVFDASAATTTGLSLNNALMVGPKIQHDLFAILCRFRKHKYVIVADIEKMYRQVYVEDKQRNLQRILWRPNTSEKLKHYMLNTVTYGTASASFLAIRALHEVANLNRDSCPELCRIIKEDFYVDDLITGSESIEQAVTIKESLTNLLSLYGFPLHKWGSNENKIITNGDKANEDSLAFLVSDNNREKTLGIVWNKNLDTLHYSVNLKDQVKITKRTILSNIAQIFDPLGLITPITVRAKLIMQKLWSLNLAWDESVPVDMHTFWVTYRSELKLLNKLNIPRCALITEYNRLEIHGFCDASKEAYGACIYLKTIRNDKTSIHLLCSKSRVAPLKEVTLPRLELCGALLLAQLVHKVMTSLNLKVDGVFLWCDSTITLHWIMSGPERWTTFVSNRVRDILSTTHIGQWRHVPTASNSADLLTRGVKIDKLIHSELWWNGPEWLKFNEQCWPSKVITAPKTISDLKPMYALVAVVDNKDLFDRFSSLRTLQRVLAYCLRFVKRSKKQAVPSDLNLSSDELNASLSLLIKLTQRDVYSTELKQLESKKLIKDHSKLLTLNPFISDGILRVGGRISNSYYNFDMKHPIILPSHHQLTKLLIKSEHMKQLHAGPQCLLATIRQKYWIVNGLNTVKGVLRKCLVCFRVRPRFTSYLMGNLPRERINVSKPFEVVGIDFCGPFHTKNSQIRNRIIIKTYLCVFVCFSTKAVHLEIVSDLTSESFLNTLKRFVSRRGLCKTIYCDNATNFVGAKNALNHLTDSIITTFCSENKIAWKFIPARSPHWGGLWESAVKSAKSLFAKVIGQQVLSYEELHTVFTQIEAILNSRPLSPLSSHPDDLLALTPGHFLIGRPLNALPQQDVTEEPATKLKRFLLLQQMYQHFWARWSGEYIRNLQQRQRWAKNTNNAVKPGTMVLLQEDHTAPLNWKLARILEVFPGADGVVRSVKLKCTNGETTRSVRKICILPNDD